MLLLRYGEIQKELKDISDMELNASDLRIKYDVSDVKLTALNEARQRYTNKKHGREPEDEWWADTEEGEIVMTLDAIGHVRTKRKIEHVDNMLFFGLEHSMSEPERAYVVQLMTSGDTEKLVQAAQILGSIVHMNRIRQTLPKEEAKDSDEDHSLRAIGSSHSMSSTSSAFHSQRTPPRRHASSASGVPMPSHFVSHIQQQTAQRNKWSTMYPLPFRMPRVVTLPINFDLSLRNCPIRFVDDESTLSFLKYNERYNRINYEDRLKIVQDAFSTLSVSPWKRVNRVVKTDCSNFPGAENIMLGLEHDVEDRQLPDMKVPWRRVIVSYVHRSFSNDSGLRVGDVVTHLDGEPFDGNVEKLKFVLDAKKNEDKVESDTATVEIVVNAEVSVAEALRLRSFMARNQGDEVDLF